MDPLVTTDWLASELGSADLRVLDCTVVFERVDGVLNVESGRGRWEAGHIPGSGFVDLLTDISDQASEHRFMMPPEQQFVSHMEHLGVGDGTRVVLYDRDKNMWAARVWFMLRHFGFTDAAVLDGGWRKWTAEGREESVGPLPDHPAAVFTVGRTVDVLVEKEAVLDALGDGGPLLVNALSAAQHNGENLDYGRRGHIPGAINVPAADLVDPQSHEYLKAPALAEKLATAIDADSVIVYCGGGISAASDAFALAMLGHRDVSIYDGSMSEWGADPSLPLEY